jgi:hypothetical protein
MKRTLGQALLATCALLAGLACAEPRPLEPGRAVPAGTVLVRFNRKVEGPVELSVDGTRVAVERTSKKKCGNLEISGLALGRHRLVLMSPLEAFGPDQLDVDLDKAGGAFEVVLVQQFQSVLYGKPEPAPAATGIPGVQARLQP